MNDHDEKVNEYEEYLDQFQRDQMIVKGYNLYPTSDGVDCKQFEEEWDDDRQDLMLLDVANRLQEEQRFIHKDRYIYIKWQKVQNSRVSVNETVITFYKNTLNTILKYSVQFCCR